MTRTDSSDSARPECTGPKQEPTLSPLRGRSKRGDRSLGRCVVAAVPARDLDVTTRLPARDEDPRKVTRRGGGESCFRHAGAGVCSFLLFAAAGRPLPITPGLWNGLDPQGIAEWRCPQRHHHGMGCHSWAWFGLSASPETPELPFRVSHGLTCSHEPCETAGICDYKIRTAALLAISTAFWASRHANWIRSRALCLADNSAVATHTSINLRCILRIKSSCRAPPPAYCRTTRS